jgi:hypothetical protein
VRKGSESAAAAATAAAAAAAAAADRAEVTAAAAATVTAASAITDTLAKLPEKLADSDAQVVRWQSKYGREPTIQQRAWLVSKVRSDIQVAMLATKLNARVIIKNLQNMHEKSLRVPPTGARRRMELAYQDWARLQGTEPRTGGPFDRTIGWRLSRWWSPGTGKTLQRTQLSLIGSIVIQSKKLVAFMRQRSKGPTVPAGVWKYFLSFKRHRQTGISRKPGFPRNFGRKFTSNSSWLRLLCNPIGRFQATNAPTWHWGLS